MNTQTRVARLLSVLILASSLVGAVQSAQPAQAAPSGQEGTEHWGTVTIPAPRHVQLTPLSQPPGTTPEQRALADERAAMPRVPILTTPADPDAQIRQAPPEQPPLKIGGPTTRAPSTLTIFDNAPLTDVSSPLPGIDPSGMSVSPSVANSGHDILMSYNTYGAFSQDDGDNWSYVNPEGGITPTDVCDQDVIYVPGYDMMLWLVVDCPFYDADEEPPIPADDDDGNTLHLAVFNSTYALENFQTVIYDLTPDAFCTGGVDEDWFATPHLALTDNYLYIVTNVFRVPDDTLTCTTVMRIVLDNLDTSAAMDVTFFDSTALNGFTAAHGGKDTLYFAAHVDNDTLRVFTWPESGAAESVTGVDVDHASYLITDSVCTVYGTTGPGSDPCASDDDRIQTGWLRRDLNELAFMWDVPQAPGGDGIGTFDWPYIRALVVDATTKTVVQDAYAYAADRGLLVPSAAVNGHGHVGGTFAFAGGTVGTGAIYPGGAAWVYDDYSPSLDFENLVACTGAGNPTGDGWGDFYRSRMSSLNPFQWIGSCYAMEGGFPVPHAVTFGRERDTQNRRKMDFDVDGRTDPTVFEKATGNWFSIGAGHVSTPALNFGEDPAYTLVPGFYDSDGRADAAVYEKATGHWFAVGSHDGFFTPALGFGNLGYTPVPGDYDGDGRMDAAVFEISSGNWFVVGSTLGFYSPALNFGSFEYIAVPADYDGDGRTDPAVFDTATGNWFVIGSTLGFFAPALNFGTDIDWIPVPADYDGDGMADPAVFGRDTGHWYAVGSTAGFMTVALGFGNDTFFTPEPGDYDGDGKADAAVAETATGNWFVVGSRDGFFAPALNFGNSGYIAAVSEPR